ncbi:MAG: DUF2785 domain-containing protein [Xanthomonadales bacterium]|nr:DUF2785 domain-containing protein [Xanthomonadales bacterium]
MAGGRLAGNAYSSSPVMLQGGGLHRSRKRLTQMKVRSLICLFVAVLAMPLPAMAADTCPPAGYSEEQLLELGRGGFVIADAAQRNALAPGLMACLPDPNPAIRDGVVYTGLATWLRGQSLAPETINALYANLLVQIASTADANGFQQPFAALVLSEVARTGRIDNTFTPAMRNELVEVAANYLASVRDYRGFSETEGWRHGVAHGSDLVLQLALNPNIDGAQIERLMNAVAAQVAPAGEVFYVYGEPGRLARAVFYAWARETVAPVYWQAWFDRIENPAPMKNWNEAFASQAGLARRHNTMALLLALHLNATTAGKQAEALDALVLQALNRVQGE